MIASTDRRTNPFLIYLVTSVLITMSLFYIDEGFYDFRWMASIGNWFVFVIYASVIFAFQALIYLLLSRVFSIRGNSLLVIFAGSCLAVIFLTTVVFG